MFIIMTAAKCSPDYDSELRVQTLLDARQLDLFARIRQRATENIDTAIEPKEEIKPAYERMQSALPVRAKTRRQPDGTSCLMGAQGLRFQSDPGRLLLG